MITGPVLKTGLFYIPQQKLAGQSEPDEAMAVCRYRLTAMYSCQNTAGMPTVHTIFFSKEERA